jgi:universal stress protein A
MSYKHILVAVDLSDESHLLLQKAATLAQAINAKISLIYIDVIQNDEFTRQIVHSMVDNNEEIKSYSESQEQLEKIKQASPTPIEHTIVGYGGLSQEIENAVQKHDIDLIVCGHHQDFWHTISSSAKKVMKTIPVDLLVVPLS